MTAFAFPDSPDPIRPDLAAQYRRVWEHVASPGTWWTGAERVAIAAETRRARTCPHCMESKAALSPFSTAGAHATDGVLPTAIVDAIHRVTTDAARLTKAWYEDLLASGTTPEQYVEALGVAVQVISIDEFCRALGLGEEPLPSPRTGEPARVRPDGARCADDAWVPTIEAGDVAESERDLYDGIRGSSAPGVIKALSLVPDEVRSWKELAGAQYLPTGAMMGMTTDRALDRAQIELVAGRVSALNECFY